MGTCTVSIFTMPRSVEFPAALFLTGVLIMALIDFRRAFRRSRRDDRTADSSCSGRAQVQSARWWRGRLRSESGAERELTMFLVVMCLGYWAVPPARPDRAGPS